MEATSEPITDVVFRRWPKSEGGGVLALFPGLEAKPGYCESFEHVGQHGAADYAGCISRTRPAKMTENDVKALYRELESAPYGYRLRVQVRRPRRT